MLIVKGAIVVLGSILWVGVFPFILLLETARYGFELLLDTLSRVWDRWEHWIDPLMKDEDAQ